MDGLVTIRSPSLAVDGGIWMGSLPCFSVQPRHPLFRLAGEIFNSATVGDDIVATVGFVVTKPLKTSSSEGRICAVWFSTTWCNDVGATVGEAVGNDVGATVEWSRFLAGVCASL